jgi:hypothetical protein
VGLLTHERFGRYQCGRCHAGIRQLMGCPFPIPDGPDAAELEGPFEPVPEAERESSWPRWVIAFPKTQPPWESCGCPWQHFALRPEIDQWMAAHHWLAAHGKTPVELGVWPELRGDYLDVMTLIDSLLAQAEAEVIERERDRARRIPGG